MNIIYNVLLIVVIFFAQNVMNFIGISDNKPIYAIYMAVAICLIVVNRNCIIRRNKHFLWLMIVIILACFVKSRLDNGPGSRDIAVKLLCAPLIFSCFPIIPKGKLFWRKATRVLFGFYIIECGLAIFERVTLINIFPWIEGDDSSFNIMDTGIAGFRSFALLGHPLMNALPVCTMMAFILCSQSLSWKKKMSLWVLGYITLLCFNTRGSIVGAALILGLYVLKEYFTDKKLSFAKKNLALIGLIAGTGALVFIAIHFQLGGRLLEMGLFDQESAQVRVNTWDIFNYFDMRAFLWGMDQNTRTMVIYQSGLWTTENFWIDYMLIIGLVPLAIILIFYIISIKDLYKGYKKFDVLITVASFILIASTNNSLSATWIPLFLYLMMISCFSFKEGISDNLEKSLRK